MMVLSEHHTEYLPVCLPFLSGFLGAAGMLRSIYIYIYIYIYILCLPTRNRYNEFILHKIKMADFECQQLQIWLEFVR